MRLGDVRVQRRIVRLGLLGPVPRGVPLLPLQRVLRLGRHGARRRARVHPAALYLHRQLVLDLSDRFAVKVYLRRLAPGGELLHLGELAHGEVEDAPSHLERLDRGGLVGRRAPARHEAGEQIAVELHGAEARQERGVFADVAARTGRRDRARRVAVGEALGRGLVGIDAGVADGVGVPLARSLELRHVLQEHLIERGSPGHAVVPFAAVLPRAGRRAACRGERGPRLVPTAAGTLEVGVRESVEHGHVSAQPGVLERLDDRRGGIRGAGSAGQEALAHRPHGPVREEKPRRRRRARRHGLEVAQHDAQPERAAHPSQEGAPGEAVGAHCVPPLRRFENAAEVATALTNDEKLWSVFVKA